MFKTILHNARVSVALLGVGMLTLTGCGGASVDTSVAVADVQQSVATPASPAPAVNSAPPPSPENAPSPPAPEIIVKEEWVESTLPFDSVREDDPSADLGVESLLVAGAVGVLATRFEVTVTDGVETGRVAVAEEVRVAPVTEVIGVGSRAPVAAVPPPPVQVAAGTCDPNYEGDCVPIDSDVDCASGSGNGPSYVQGPVRVVGTDIYGLDRDGDGAGCE